MLTLKDIPIFIVKEIKSYKKLYDRLIVKAFNQHQDILQQLQQEYHLSIADIGKHIQYDLEFCEHKCLTCGKPTHWNRELKSFANFCCASCMAKNPDIVEKRLKIFKEKYGGNAPICSTEIKSKIANTNLSRYGVVNIAKSKEVKDKITATNLAKYGVKRPIQNQEIKAKIQKHFQEAYGGNSPFSSEEVRSKSKETLLEKYGVDNVFKSDVIKEKIKTTNLEKYGVEYTVALPEVIKRKEATNLKKYGHKCSLQNEEIKGKAKETLIEKYGVENIMQSDAFTQKASDRMLDQGYDNLILKTINNPNSKVIPLFSREEYTGSSYTTVYRWKCRECGEEFDATYGNAVVPTCRKCHPITISSGQQEVIDYIKSLNPELDLIINDRTQIKPLELDIYIPSLKLAIEFNGYYWHSESQAKDKYYHLNKTKLCENKGIHLIHIFEYDWMLKKDLIKQRLRNQLINSEEDKVFARKCVVREIDFKITTDFLNQNHLQGSCPSKVNLGLFYKDELVSVMTFGKPRFNKNYEWELLRFCSSKLVIGSAGKLLKYFERNYKPKSLLSYANRCWSSKLSNVYEKIGFKLIGESEPSYIWVKNNIVLSRYQCQKHKLKELLGEEKFDINLTEDLNMLNNGFKKVFDCGNLVFSKVYRED